MNEKTNKVEIYTINIEPPNSRKLSRDRFEENFVKQSNKLIIQSLKSKSMKSKEEIMFLEENRLEGHEKYVVDTENHLLSLDHSECHREDFQDKALVHNFNNNSSNKTKKFIKQSTDINFLSDLRRKINQAEDQDETEKLFSKTKVNELLCSILTFIGVCSSIIYYQIKTYGLSYESNGVNMRWLDLTISFSLIMCTISTILCIISTAFKYHNYHLLFISTKYIMRSDKFFSWKNINFRYALLEMTLAALHPNYILKGKFIILIYY